MRTFSPVFDFDRDTRAIAHAASELAKAEGWPTMTPELLLLAALHDEEVASFWGATAATAAASELRSVIERQQQGAERQQQGEAAAGEADSQGWSPSAQHVVIAAFARAMRRRYQRPEGVEAPPPVAPDPSPRWAVRALNAMMERARTTAGDRTWIGRADLLHGLATQGSHAATLLAPLPRLYGRLDAEDPLVAPGDVTGQPAGPGEHRASVVFDDDAESTMQAVVALLRDELGLPEVRAAVAMHRVHFRGADRVVTLPWDDAQRAVVRCRVQAKASAPRLGMRLVPA